MTESPNRLVNPQPQPEDRLDQTLRPKTLSDLIGQDRIKENLSILIEAARQRGESLDHVLFYGPPGLGKCITADSLILTGRGLELFESLLPDSMTVDSYSPVDTLVYGVNGLEAASHVYFSGVRPTIKLLTRSGFALEGTLNHPVLVATSQGLNWKPLAELTAEDYVAIGRGMGIDGEVNPVLWIPGSPSDRRLYSEENVVQMHSELAGRLGRSPTAREITLAFYGEDSRTPTPELTAKRLGLALSDGRTVGTAFLPGEIVYRRTERVGKAICLDADLAYLLGVLVGDGHFEKGRTYPACTITSGEEEMQVDLQRIVHEHFGFRPKIKQYRQRTAQIRFAQSIGKVFLQWGVKAANAAQKEVPNAVLTGPRRVMIGFIQGLFDADGNVWPDGSIEYSTRSEVLSRQVQLLLANLGIIANRSEKQIQGKSFWSLFIGADEDVACFHHEIGFRLNRKRFRFNEDKLTGRGWGRSQLIPGANPILAKLLDISRPHARKIHKIFDHVKRNDRVPTRKRIEKYLSLLPAWVQETPEYHTLRLLMNSGIYWDKVQEIKHSSTETYDFVVPGSHSFLANGFYCHNTTLAHVLANEMGVNIKITAGPAIERPGDLAAILTNLRAGDILFIDEIHRLGRAIEEVLYPAMEDFALDIIIGKGPSARSIRLKLPRFTVIGATTRLALVTAPLRARFGAVYRLNFYDFPAMQSIVSRAARVLGVEAEPEGVDEIARRGRGTPRVGLRLLRRVRDYAEVRADGVINSTVSQEALDLLEVDGLGLDDIDRRVLHTIIEKYNGGPVGLSTIAASISEETDTIMDVVEPYLLQLGFLERTPQGRLATRRAYEHMGMAYPKNEQPKMF